jgi:PKHD-type hydroxylase
MNLEHYYWYFKSAVTPEQCNKIIDLGIKTKFDLGTVGGIKIKNYKKISKEEKNQLIKIRKSNVAWLEDKWLYDLITPYITTANKNANWNFQVDWFENIQFTIYKKSQFYDWHQDCWDKPYEMPNPNYNGKIRKISATIQLSDPKDYKGGELQFDFRNQINKSSNIIKPKELLPQGTIVVFPSHIYHKVTPVTKGTRYSLVLWSLGKPWI